MSTIDITPNAIQQLGELVESLAEDDVKVFGLRVYVSGGGCSGFQYGFAFVEEVDEDDSIYVHPRMKEVDGGMVPCDPVNIVCDPMSLMYLEGSTVDYKSDLQGSNFTIKNPNATSTCGCDKSFSV